MNNEEKILALLSQMNSRFDTLEARFDRVEIRLDRVEARLDRIEEDIEQIKEDTAVTRSAVNSLIAWADQVALVTRVDFPVKDIQCVE